jgi:hypothetical protein
MEDRALFTCSITAAAACWLSRPKRLGTAAPFSWTMKPAVLPAGTEYTGWIFEVSAEALPFIAEAATDPIRPPEAVTGA